MLFCKVRSANSRHLCANNLDGKMGELRGTDINPIYFSFQVTSSKCVLSFLLNDVQFFPLRGNFTVLSGHFKGLPSSQDT